MLHESPDRIFTISKTKEIIEKATGKKVKRNTLGVYYRRLSGKGIAEPVSIPDQDEPAYRLASKFKAQSYLDGHFQDYTPGMTPTSPPIRPADSVKHRPVYKLQLSNSELERVREAGIWERFGRSPGYHRVNRDTFSLRAWSSGKARIFLTGDWRPGLDGLFGDGLVKQVESEIANKNGHVGWARHPPVKTDKLPVGNIMRVVSPDGKITIFQYGFSQIKTGELDRHGPENEPYADLAEKYLFDELKFKTDIVNRFASIDRTLSSLPDEIGRAVAEAIKKTIAENAKPSEPEYKPTLRDRGDYVYS